MMGELLAETVAVVLGAAMEHTHVQSATTAISSPRSNHSVTTLLQATPGFLFSTSQSFCVHSERKLSLVYSIANLINAAL